MKDHERCDDCIIRMWQLPGEDWQFKDRDQQCKDRSAMQGQRSAMQGWRRSAMQGCTNSNADRGNV